MTRSRSLRHHMLLLSATIALVATACSGTSSPTSAQSAHETTHGTTATTTAGTTASTTAEPLAGVTVVNENTFTVELRTPDPEFPLRLSYVAFAALPKIAFDDPTAFEQAPVGSGPFMMRGTWQHDERITLDAYPDYQGSNRARIDTLEFRIYPNFLDAYDAAAAGDLDVLTQVPVDRLSTYRDDFPGHNGETYVGGVTYLGIPASATPLTKQHRQALAMAIDRDEIARDVFLGSRDPAHSMIPPSLHGRPDVCTSWDFDPVAARKLWESAGDPGPITVSYVAGRTAGDWLDRIAGMWRDNLGIDPGAVTLQALDGADYFSMLEAQQIDGPFRTGWIQDYPSPLNFLEPLFASYNMPPAGSNTTFYANAEFDAALQAGKARIAKSGRSEDGLDDYFRAEDILCDDVPAIPLLFTKYQYVYSGNVDGVRLDASGNLALGSIESKNGHVSVAVQEPETLFLTDSFETQGSTVLAALFAPLVRFDPATNELIYEHASSITSNDNGKTWRIVLRPGWRFHDGTPITASDYARTWAYGADPANHQHNRSYYSAIVGFEP